MIKFINNIFFAVLDFLPEPIQISLEYRFRKFTKQLEPELYLLENLIERKGRVIDVGANRGIYAYFLSKKGYRVEAFEPQSYCTKSLIKYSKLFRKEINVYNCCLADKAGRQVLNIPIIRGRFRETLATGLASIGNFNGDLESKCVEVDTHRLDDYHFQDVVFIKIDVEGYEKQVIEGGRETILREKPILFVEIEQRHLNNTSIDLVFDQIFELGYQGLFLLHEELVDIENFSCEKHQKMDANTNFQNTTETPYVNNFLFTPID